MNNPTTEASERELRKRQMNLARQQRRRENLTNEARTEINLRQRTITQNNVAAQTPEQTEERLLRQRIISQNNVASETPEQTAARLLRVATNNRLARNLTSTEFDDHNRLLVSQLNPHQIEAPTASQLLYPERHALSSVFLYHHHTGHEFIDSGRQVLEQR